MGVRAKRTSQAITWMDASVAQAQLQLEYRDRVRVVTKLIEADGFWGVWHRYTVQQGLRPCHLQGATAALAGLPAFYCRARGASGSCGGSSLG